MADQFVDTFEDSNGTPLVQHTPDLGTGWILDQAGGVDIQIFSDVAWVDFPTQSGFHTDSTPTYRIDPDPTNKFFELQVDLNSKLNIEAVAETAAKSELIYSFYLRKSATRAHVEVHLYVSVNRFFPNEAVQDKFLTGFIRGYNGSGYDSFDIFPAKEFTFGSTMKMINGLDFRFQNSFKLQVDLSQHRPGSFDPQGVPREWIRILINGIEYNVRVPDTDTLVGSGDRVALDVSILDYGPGTPGWLDNFIIRGAQAARASDPLSMLWDIEGRKVDSLVMLWDTERPEKDLSIQWDVRAEPRDLRMLWDINQRPSDPLFIAWDTRPRLTDDLTTEWDVVPTRTELDLVMRWDVQCLPPLVSVDIDERLPLRVEVQVDCGVVEGD